ncbi:DNA polymerase III subunit epsilon [Enterococcus florum]|uniref:3'-5' exonuclease DinG n=2 Tax=Enterococcus florum TaxID=2480627 RepID=A0A4P5P694_9ENTE|nr:DNA polymerase III subunit epsilon [Enterococcus florum]
MKKTYAVVDIETTGTDAATDRIIQFGCVLVEDGEIVTRFATDINPDKGISKQIQTLTGITNQRVRQAPFFEDVAETIFNLLEDTIFIAHNIFFDYTFLSNELTRCGMPPLTIPGIDTVELAQIFLPTSLSFRLSDLSTELGLAHRNPHQADSDAEVTAQLFLRIEQKIRSLPLVTMEKISRLTEHMAFQTGDYLQDLFDEMAHQPKELSEDLQIVQGIALKKKSVALFEETYYGNKAYPRAKKAKERLYQDQLVFRREQSRLMNLVYDFFTKKTEKNTIVEAATGLGKTLGYLLPMSYLASPEKPLVISTASLLLQEQIITHDLPLLNRLLDQPLQAVIMKSSRHYIDLVRYQQTLQKRTEHKQYSFYQMAVLVWLTQTETGDFDELNMTSLQHAFWRDVAHQGIETISPASPFYTVDFLRHREKKAKQSNVYVTNHAFLAHEGQRRSFQLPESPYLIIDEAHHLNRILEQVSTHQVSALNTKKHLNRLAETEAFDKWKRIAESDRSAAHMLDLLEDILTELVEDLLDLFETCKRLAANGKEPMISKEQLDQSSYEGEKLIQRVSLLYDEALQASQQVQAYFMSEKDRFSLKQQGQWGEFTDLYRKLERQKESFELFFEQWKSRYIHWLKEQDQSFHVQDLAASLLPETAWYQRYQQILYLGGTMKIGSDRRYFARRWGIPETALKVIPSPYDYEKQARLYIPTDGIAIQETSPEKYANYLSKLISQLAKKEKRPILVLFTSHDILNRVYHHMKVPLLNEGREVLAQGIGGSREKLLKRFLLSEDALLFGADSFWEGIDLPGEVLQILVVTRLPFENPQRLQVKARNDFLEQQGINPFFQESVPHAALRLRQALGRLIRSETDKGVMLLLDRRLITARYGGQLRKSLPKELPVVEAPFDEVLEELSDFLSSDKNPNNQ